MSCACGLVWEADRAAIELLYRQERDPSLCPACREQADLAVLAESLASRRCICMACWGHEGRCPNHTHRGGLTCRACGQWDEPSRKFRAGMAACVRCGHEARGRALYCSHCSYEDTYGRGRS